MRAGLSGALLSAPLQAAQPRPRPVWAVISAVLIAALALAGWFLWDQQKPALAQTPTTASEFGVFWESTNRYALPSGVCHDGTNIWVAAHTGTIDYRHGVQAEVKAYNPANGSRGTGSVNSLSRVLHAPITQIWCSSTRLWALRGPPLVGLNPGNPSLGLSHVEVFNLSNGNWISTWTLPASPVSRRGLWSDDGTHAWTAQRPSIYSSYSSEVYRTNQSRVINQRVTLTDIDRPGGVTGDATHVWVLSQEDCKILAYSRSNGARAASKDRNLPHCPRQIDRQFINGLTSDGTNFWVNYGTSSNAAGNYRGRIRSFSVVAGGI